MSKVLGFTLTVATTYIVMRLKEGVLSEARRVTADDNQSSDISPPEECFSDRG